MIALDFDLAVGHDEFTLEARATLDVSVLGLVGSSGAGKTTLLEALAGLVPARGRVRIGESTWLDSAAGVNLSLPDRRVGYVPQDARLFPHLTVRGNLAYGTRDEARVALIAEMLEVAHLLDRPAARLSGGERQRVALGRALAISPALLLLDEPLGALDPARRERILPYVLRARQALGVPMIWVTHDLDELTHAADHALVLDGGRVVYAGDVPGVRALAARTSR